MLFVSDITINYFLFYIKVLFFATKGKEGLQIVGHSTQSHISQEPSWW